MTWSGANLSPNQGAAVVNIEYAPHASVPGRIHGFDFLRGICAIVVAVYHMLHWSDIANLHAWALFGVYIFFVLSGASLVLAYRDRFDRGFPASTFLALRVARIAPLFVLTVTAYLAMNWPPSWNYALTSIINVPLLFGMGNPGLTSQVTGGWSLGIEFVFYLMFPLMLSVAACSGRLWIALLLAVSQLVFINVVLDGKTLESAWSAYTQPLAFVAYFYSGCLIGLAVLDGVRPHRLLFAVTLLGILAGSGATAAETLTGLRGMVLFSLAIAVVYFSAGLTFGAWRRGIAAFLGDTSYGVYLLHPLVFLVVRKLGLPTPYAIAVTLVATLAAAYASHRLYEEPIRNWAKHRAKGHRTV
jgi:exopolysaccharide production protein ExoZ